MCVQHFITTYTIYYAGIAMTGASSSGPAADLVSSNQVSDYSFIRQPFLLGVDYSFLRCASGLGPSGSNQNTILGGWYFGGIGISVGSVCTGSVLQVRTANPVNYPGVINLYLCGTFTTTTEEGVYSCIMMNSAMMNQTMRVGVYLSGRSESLDMYPIISLLTIIHLST